MKSYMVKATAYGPAVVYNNDIVFLTDSKRLFDLVDEIPTLLADIHQTVIDDFKMHSGFLIDSLIHYQKLDPVNTRMALDVVQSYHRFIYSEYPEYRAQMAEIFVGNRNTESIIETNPPHVNEFYDLLSGKH